MRPSPYSASLSTYDRGAVLSRLALNAAVAVNFPQAGSCEVNASDVAAWPAVYSSEPVFVPKSHGRLRALDSYSGGIHRAPSLREHARWIATELERRRGEYDFVAVTGQSGMSVAFAALMLYEFPLAVVRKGERTHGTMIEGAADKVGRYIVVDDFISSGATMRRINKELCKWAAENLCVAPEHVGSLLYTKTRFDPKAYLASADD